MEGPGALGVVIKAKGTNRGVSGLGFRATLGLIVAVDSPDLTGIDTLLMVETTTPEGIEYLNWRRPFQIEL